MARAQFSHEFKSYKGRNFLVIEDHDMGAMSVTNDIENVVKECFHGEQVKPDQVYIIYLDSDGMWDGWDARTETFVSLQQPTEEDAKDAIIRKYEGAY